MMSTEKRLLQKVILNFEKPGCSLVDKYVTNDRTFFAKVEHFVAQSPNFVQVSHICRELCQNFSKRLWWKHLHFDLTKNSTLPSYLHLNLKAY